MEFKTKAADSQIIDLSDKGIVTVYINKFNVIDESGDLEFTISDDCTSFTGKWRHESEENWSGQWNGKRIEG